MGKWSSSMEEAGIATWSSKRRCRDIAGDEKHVELRASERAVIVGETTGGSTGEPIQFDLPGGGKGWICSCYTAFPDGKQFVGEGLKPDIPVRRTIQGVIDGRDEVLDEALMHI